jgi:cell division protein FtsQ
MPSVRRFLRPALWTIVILLLLGGGLVVSLALFTGTCRIQHVNFSGNKYLQADHLRQLSGIEEYTNLVTLPVGRIARNLMGDPWVKSVKVQRHLLHTVNIRIDERVPVAVLDCGGTAFLVEGDGYVIGKIKPDEFKELPRVHNGSAAPPMGGAIVTDKKVLECIKAIGGMPASVRAILALGNPFDGRGSVFITTLGFNIIYGPTTGQKNKNEVLEAVVTDVKNNKRSIEYIDVRVPDSPVIKPK